MTRGLTLQRSTVQRATILAAAIALAVTGCSAPAAPEAEPAPPPVTSPAPSVPDSGAEGDTDDAAPLAQPGAYVDYRDGIIAETAGAKALFFHASWCPQCRSLEESILAGDIPDDLTIIKVDYDTATSLRQQYGVTIQTTIVFVDDDGSALASEVLYSDTTLDALIAAAP